MTGALLWTVSQYSVSTSLTLYHKLLTSPPPASHPPHYGLVSLTLRRGTLQSLLSVDHCWQWVAMTTVQAIHRHPSLPAREWEWTKVGDIPAARNHGSGVVLPSGDLLVTGGQDSSLKLTSQVDVASVLNLCLIPKPHSAGLGMRFAPVLFCLHSDH